MVNFTQLNKSTNTLIESLHIKDYALIDQLDVTFGRGLNIITGQTGAGKSIIIGALNLVLGERADTDAIRNGAQKAVAEAVLKIDDNSNLKHLLEESQVELTNQLILRREVRESGSRAFINDTPVSVNVLKQVGDLLVDLHGQHDHQLLLKEENHRMVLDSMDIVQPVLQKWQSQYRKVMQLRRDLQVLKKRESELNQKQELYRFQVRELETANMDSDEEDNNAAEMRLLDNAEELDQKAALINELGSEGETNVQNFLSVMEKALEDLAKIEPGFENYLREFSTACVSIDETMRHTERYRSTIEFNPQRLEELRVRQAELKRLQKKYGKNTNNLIQLLDELRAELTLADNFDLEIEKLTDELKGEMNILSNLAIQLFNARKNAGHTLSEALVKELSRLGIPHARFNVGMSWLEKPGAWMQVNGKDTEATETGASDVRFLISTNRGEELKPLSKTASGGEISRIMLALKSILVRAQSLPVMIFDEIDIGISGSVADQVGQTMRELSSTCQIIAITHQPQIACYAHYPYRVEKSESKNRSVTRILALNRDEHIRELATLMSGAKVTEAALESARTLLPE